MAALQRGDFTPETRVVGSGPTVVLVHGSASDGRTWEAQIDPFAEHHTVVTYSRRYHWPNEPADDDTSYSMSEHVDDLVGVIESTGGVPVDLIGHSYGGFVALLTSLRHPDLVRRQILIEPPVVPLFLSDPPRPRELLRVLTRRPTLGLALLRFGATGLVPATKAASNNDMDRAIRKSGTAILGKAAFERLDADRWKQVEANNIRAEYLSESFEPLSADEVGTLRTPTLLITGENSPRLWRMLTGELDDLLPDSRRVDVSAASHIVHEDNPSAFNEAALNFLDGAD